MTDASPTYVLDACALTAFVRREAGADVMDTLIADPTVVRVVHAVNLCEVYYDSLRDALSNLAPADAQAAAQQVVQSVYAAGVQLRDDMDPAFWQSVGQLKVNPGRLSLADCFTLALAMRLGATLVTSDHHEFDAVAPLGLCPILFIR